MVAQGDRAGHVLCDGVFEQVGRDGAAEVLRGTTGDDVVVRVVFVARLGRDQVSDGRHGALFRSSPQCVAEVVVELVLSILLARRQLPVLVHLVAHR